MTESDDHALPDSGRNLAERSRIAQWSSLAALAISALALAIGAYQTRLMQTQARASVWPYVVLGLSYADKDDADFDLHVQNNGVGPAIVRSVRVTFDGKPLRHWSDLFEPLMTHGSVDAVLAGLKGIVIPPATNRNTDVVAIRIRQADAAKAFYAARTRLTMDVCFCSIYGDCWIAHWLVPQPEPVAACRESGGDFDF